MLNGFRTFILRGNVIDLAVAVVVGAAFSTIVTTFIENFINPIVGLIFKAESLKTVTWVIPGTSAELGVGEILSAVITFVLTAAVLYFCFVAPMNKYLEKRKTVGDEAAVTDTDLLTEIRDLLAARK